MRSNFINQQFYRNMLNILVIDDDKITHSFIKRALENLFILHDVFSGDEGLQAAKDLKPDIILLDVEMPGKNGYEVCELLKTSEATQNIPVIFLSANRELRDVMLGFVAGADDYIVKPFQADALRAKLNVISRYHEQNEELSHQVEVAQKTAYTALTGTSDLGQVIRFVEQCYDITNYNGLAQALFQVTNTLQLSCTLLIKSIEGDDFHSSKSLAIPPLERELITTLHDEKRFIDFGGRTQINYKNISVLIKNMPLDDADRYGRIKDLFPAMLGTADAKITQLDTLNALISNTDEINGSFLMVTDSLNKIKKSINDNQKHNIKIMRDMMMELDLQLPKMGLESDQEQYILDRIDNAITEAHDAADITRQLNTSFNIILDNLDELVVNQKQLQDNFSSLTDTSSNEEKDEGYTMDVELF